MKKLPPIDIKIIHTIIDEAYELMGNDTSKAMLWLTSPSPIFMGDSPFDVCIQGEGKGKEVLKWLQVRLGKVQGAGF